MTQQIETRISLTIYGQLSSIKNGRQLVYARGKPRFVPKKEAQTWEKLALLQTPQDHRIGMTGDIILTCTVYYQSNRSDLDIAAVMDYLQHAGIIKNDRQVVQINATKKIDPANPRVDLIVEELN